jgi:2-polyprenyl-3-methyl-5-hydroxy-6-metoxy-1,4-benzoquinol methylase
MMICRSCESNDIQSIIPLGKLPLANGLLDQKQDHEPYHNLEVMLCNNCGLAQLKDLIDPKDLFSEYVYFSSNSEGMLNSVAALVERIQPTLLPKALVVEIASNDGYLLKNYKGVDVFGIDPAANIAKAANESGVPTLCDFFSEQLATTLVSQGKQADIIHANNVMAHVPNINGFVKGIKLLLKKTGQAIIEVPHFLDLFTKLEFDTIYHEHVYYFGLKPLMTLFQRHDLEIFNVEKLSIHGGTLRLFVGHNGQHDISDDIEKILYQEELLQLYNSASYQKFMKQLQKLKENLITLLQSVKSQGKQIAAYGASAKGTTLLNYFGIGTDFLNFVVDRSAAKRGKLTPGTQLEILAPPAMLEADYAILLAWNFADEIIQQQENFINMGGKFIVPLPEVKILP